MFVIKALDKSIFSIHFSASVESKISYSMLLFISIDICCPSAGISYSFCVNIIMLFCFWVIRIVSDKLLLLSFTTISAALCSYDVFADMLRLIIFVINALDWICLIHSLALSGMIMSYLMLLLTSILIFCPSEGISYFSCVKIIALTCVWLMLSVSASSLFLSLMITFAERLS